MRRRSGDVGLFHNVPGSHSNLVCILATTYHFSVILRDQPPRLRNVLLYNTSYLLQRSL